VLVTWLIWGGLVWFWTKTDFIDLPPLKGHFSYK
jgi:hypothetical protein